MCFLTLLYFVVRRSVCLSAVCLSCVLSGCLSVWSRCRPWSPWGSCFLLLNSSPSVESLLRFVGVQNNHRAKIDYQEQTGIGAISSAQSTNSLSRNLHPVAIIWTHRDVNLLYPVPYSLQRGATQKTMIIGSHFTRATFHQLFIFAAAYNKMHFLWEELNRNATKWDQWYKK